MSRANTRQVGGSHYKNGKREHWDVTERNGVGYLEAAATKYVSRCRKKGRFHEDVAKAGHYVQKLTELHDEGVRGPRGRVPWNEFIEYRDAEGLTEREARFCELLFRWTMRVDLEEAAQLVQEILQDGWEPPEATAIEAVSSAPLQRPLEGRPGTPEDGGHHARQQEEDDGV